MVSTSLAAGSRQLARRKVLVKRLVCIEDLGDMDVLVTDKTGTLTEGRITFREALDPQGGVSDDALLFGLLATEGDLSGDHLGATRWTPPSGRPRTRECREAVAVWPSSPSTTSGS
ncbi:hypothetical protein ACFQZC_37790 [Streptacidiphilus monticola]